MLIILILGIISFIYWLTLFFVSSADIFNHIWLLICILLLLLYGLLRQYYRFPKRIPLSLVVSSNVCFILGILVFMIVSILIFTGVSHNEEPGLDYVIVLGSRLDKDSLASPTLIKRLDKAKEYLDNNENAVLVLSGGVLKGYDISEAQVMANYLTNRGVAKDRLLLEIQSRNTLENIIYSKALIERVTDEERKEGITAKIKVQKPVETVENRPQRIGILTSNFHSYRAMRLAEKIIPSELYSISAPSSTANMLNMYLRECLAILKEKFMGDI